MTTGLYYFMRSPLLRYPSLGWRKFRKRLGAQEVSGPAQAPVRLEYACPAGWKPKLAAWFAACDLHGESYPWNRVFGREFPEEELWERCARGPAPDERGLLGDVKLPWEFSRGYAFTLNAARAGNNADQVANDTAAAMERWLAANTDLDGCTWTCAMEVAIRAVNWIFADVLLDGNIAQIIGKERWAHLLWRHGETVWRRLETRLTANSNHYIANLLGLWIVGQCFPDDLHARQWRTFAQREFSIALVTQTYSDGSLNESSLPYHALVTEMALLFWLGSETDDGLSPSARQRIKAMCMVLADLCAADGDVFRIGDDDGGRVVPLDFVMRKGGRVDALLALTLQLAGEKFEARSQAHYPCAGWWIVRRDDWTVVVEHGATRRQKGCGHSHNDTLEALAEWKGRPLLVDPASYVYTSDPSARNEFRSAWSHSTMIVNEEEHNPLSRDADGVFCLTDRHGPARLVAESAGHSEMEWIYRISRSKRLGLRRSITIKNNALTILDSWKAGPARVLTWIFHFAPHIEAQAIPNGFLLQVPGSGCLKLTCLSKITPVWQTLHGRIAPFYGDSLPSLRLMAQCVPAGEAGSMKWCLCE